MILIHLCSAEDHPNIVETITNDKKKFFPSRFQVKYVDDLTIAEAFNIQESVVENSDRPLPDNFHARLGQKLVPEKSLVYDEIRKVQDYAMDNEMKLNAKKSKFMLFNPTLNFDFIPEVTLENKEIETQEEMKLLGLTLTNDLSWNSNTENMTKKAYSRLWMIKRLKKRGANLEDLIEI